jgi:hypothetical protein
MSCKCKACSYSGKNHVLGSLTVRHTKSIRDYIVYGFLCYKRVPGHITSKNATVMVSFSVSI